MKIEQSMSKSKIFMKAAHESMAEMIPKIKDLDYEGAKNLLKEIENAHKNSSLQSFWSISSILWAGDFTADQHDILSEWLQESIKPHLPKKRDDFLTALFTNNREEARRLGGLRSPYIPLLLSSPANRDRNIDDIPDFMLTLTLSTGTRQIPGKTIWALLSGDIKPILEFKLNWILVFALHYWYCFEDIDIKSAFTDFCNIDDKFLRKQEKNDPVFGVFKYYSQNDNSLLDIASQLPPLDSFFFLSILDQLLKNNTNDAALAIKPCVEHLVSVEKWEYAAGILAMMNLDDDLKHLLEMKCDETNIITHKERMLIDTFGIPEPLLIESKANRLVYCAKFEKKSDVVLDQYAMAIDTCINTNIEMAHHIIFDLYIPLMTYLGTGDKRLNKWASVLVQQIPNSGKMQTDIFMIDAMRRVNEGENLLRSDVEKIGKELENGWGTFALRRHLCSLFMKQEGAFHAFYHVDAVPKDELLAVSNFD